LNESIFGDELNILVKAPKDVPNVAFHYLVNWVLFISNLFVFVNNILEDNSDESNQCNDK